MAANYDNFLDRMLDHHYGPDKKPDTFRVVTTGSLQGLGDVEERPGTVRTHVVTILAGGIDILASAQHLAIKLCESMHRTVWAETESDDPETLGYYVYDPESASAVEDK